MTPTAPSLGWAETLVMIVFIGVCVAGIVFYHRWLDRRLARERREPGDQRRA